MNPEPETAEELSNAEITSLAMSYNYPKHPFRQWLDDDGKDTREAFLFEPPELLYKFVRAVIAADRERRK